MKDHVVVVLYPGCIFFEVSLALELIAKKYEIVYATPDGADHVASNGARFTGCVAYSDVDLSKCRAVLIPGGNPGSIRDDAAIDRLIVNAHERKLWLAAICAGPFVLAKAKVLDGRRIAHGYSKSQLEKLSPYFRGVNLTSLPFIADDTILTARPEAHIEFAVELACRLGCADPTLANRTKEYYRGTLGRKIRTLALALIRNSKGQLLLLQAQDRMKGETFYRPLGGGVEFLETGRDALAREIQEELGLSADVSELKSSFENIFEFEGMPGHEVIMLFEARLNDVSAYDRESLNIMESGNVIGQAVWRTPVEIRNEGARLYPNGLSQILERDQ